MMRPPLHAIKIPLLLLLTAVVLASMGIWWSTNTLRIAESARKQQAQASLTAQQQVQRSNTEKALIQKNLAAYRALVARGFVGPENRLAWLESVQQANRDAALYGLDYSLAPREPVAVSGSSVPLGQSLMKLRMPILIEDDLGHFLTALQARSASMFRLRSCEISRTDETPPQALNKPGLEVECELLWFTVAPAARRVQ